VLPASVEARDGESCSFCGTQLEPAQEYCLECGGRVPCPSGTLHLLGSAWRRRLGSYPGDWIWLSLAAAVIAAAGATAAILATRDSRRRAVETIVATSPIPRAPATTARTSEATLPAFPGAPKEARNGRLSPILAGWPDGDGYTIVLESVPTKRGPAAAQAKAQAAARLGLPQVGVLESSGYASLHPGYYVIFSGVYASLEDAQTALQRASPRFPAAYARQIVP
jgi:hypothetical protein